METKREIRTTTLLHRSRSGKVDVDGLDAGVVGKSVLSKLSSDTRRLESSEGNSSVKLVVAVDPDGSGVDLVGDSNGSGDISGEDSRSETVLGLVGESDDLGLVLELGNDDDGSEDLLLEDGVLRVDVREDGGLDVVSLSSVSLSTGKEGSSLLLSGLDVSHDSVVLNLRDLGSLESSLVEGVTESKGLDLGKVLLHELLVDTLLNEDSGSSTASLSVVEEDSEASPRDGLINVRIVEDDVGRLSSELESDVLEVGRSSGLHDVSTDESRSSESDLQDLHVGSDGVSDGQSVTVDDVENTLGKTGFEGESGDSESSERSHLGGLEDDTVSSSKGGSELPGEHENGEVPGNDLSNNTDGLVSGVSHLRGVDVDDLSSVLVSETSVVPQASSSLGNIEPFGDREGLSVIQRLESRQLVEVGLDQLSELHQNLSSSSTGDVLSPDGLVGLLSGINSEVDISRVSLGDRGDDLSVGRVDGVEGLSVNRGNELSTDEESSRHVDGSLEGGSVEGVLENRRGRHSCGRDGVGWVV